MFKNHLKVALRNLVKNKVYSGINIGGLAVGMAGSMLILMWLQNEISFDQFHKNADHIYEVYGQTNVDGEAFSISQTSQPLGPALQESFSEVENFTRNSGTNTLLFTANEKSFSGIMGHFVDPAFLQIFNFPLLEGNANEQLKNLNSIVITEKLAKKLFGNKPALHQVIKLGLTDNFTVTGVLKDLPPNTRFDFEYLLPWDYLKKLGWNNDAWLSNNTSTFLLLNPSADVAAFNHKIKDFTRLKSGNKEVWTHFLFPLHQWHLYSEFENGKPAGGRITTVQLFGVIALFILLIACINFMNLNTARSEKSAKEVGVRKVVGAARSLLIAQFYLDAFVTSALAGGIALLMVALLLPAFNTVINTQLTLPLQNLYFWLFALGFILFTSLLAGLYPAFYLSSFKPISIFKNQFKKSKTLFSPRKVLVVFQFTFAILLVISTIVVHNQIRYGQQRDAGYAKNNLIYIDFSGDIEKNYTAIKHDLQNAGVATSLSKTMRAITQGGNNAWNFRWAGQTQSDIDNLTIKYFSADADLVKTANMQLIEGRDLDVYTYPRDSFSVLLNEAAVKAMGFKNPIGQTITKVGQNKTWTVVGVVKDYIEGSPFAQVPPTVIQGPGSELGSLHIRFNATQSTAENLAKTEKIFKKYNPAYPFDYHFIDQEYATRFAEEERSKTLAGLFALLAIFISCLGLFGLASFVAEQRTKEIGIRKVLGASVAGLWQMLSMDFVGLVLVSCLIASPIAYYLMNGWLEKYTFRIEISWWIFVVAGVGALAIALLTVSYQAIKAALLNPVKSLKSE